MEMKIVVVALSLVGCIVLQTGAIKTDATSSRSASEQKLAFLQKLSPSGSDSQTTKEEPQDPEDEAMVQTALSSAEAASKQADEEVKQQFGFIKRSLVEDEGPSIAAYSGTTNLWYPEQHQNSNSTSKLIMTADKCRDLCEGRPDCKSFSFVANGDGWCGLKSKCVTKDSLAKKFPPDNFRTWFIQKASSTWSARSLVANEGRELETKVQQTLDSCKASCEAHESCSSFTWLEAARICHLKDKCVAAEEASSDKKEATEYKTYYRPCKKWVQRELVVDEGKTLETLQLPAQKCLDECLGNPKCKSVSFKPLGQACKLNDKDVSADSPAPPQKQVSDFSTYYRPC